MNITIDNELAIVASETAVDAEIQTMLVERFTPFLDQAKEWRERAENLVVTDISQTREMKMAREARLALREIRINADKLRKELKEDSLRYGRAVQGVYNVIEAAITPIEKHLEQQEKFKEIFELKQREALRVEREELTRDVRDYMFANINLGEITEDDFQRLWNGARLQKQAAEEQARKAEEDRIAREKAAAEERERLRVENERLKAEAEAREKARRVEIERMKAEAEAKEQERRAELDRIESELRAANIKAAKERLEAEARAEAERIERERVEAELKAKQEAEARAEAERQAAIEAELSKGDKAKAIQLIADLRTLQIKYEFRSKKYKTLYFSVNELIAKIIVYITSKI
jgi:hypothetical protein